MDHSLQAFFPVPDASLNSQWQEELTAIGAGMAACEEGVIKSRSATPENINSTLSYYFSITSDSVTKLAPVLLEVSALAKGQ